jgi:hypothetical protein
MNDKFTIRDFFAYFLSGIAVLLFLFVNNYKNVTEYLFSNKDALKDYTSLVIFFSIPIAYFLGQILHGIDTVFFFFAKVCRKIKRGSFCWYALYPLIFLLSGHRISGYLFLKKENIEDFWSNCAKLQVEKNYAPSEYWYVMNDLFKGLALACFIFCIVSIFCYTKMFVFGYLLLSMIFWFRAYFFAKSFVESVKRLSKYSTP